MKPSIFQKRIAVALTATSVILFASVWRTCLGAQTKGIPSPENLKAWLYPGTSVDTALTKVPLVALHLQTSDGIAKVYAYYHNKLAHGYPISPDVVTNEQKVELFDQVPASLAYSVISATPREPNGCLFVVRQPKQTITIQVSHEAKNAHQTDIFIIRDAH